MPRYRHSLRGRARAAAVAAATLLPLVSGPAAAQQAPAPAPPPTSATLTELRRGLAQIFALELAPGMSIAVVRDTQVILLEGYGHADLERLRPMTPQTASYIASSTKSFTALAATLLDRQGTLSLDAPLSRHLPQARLAAPLSADSITLRMLLTHTHGIANGGPIVLRTAYTGEHTPELLVRLLAEHPPAEQGRAFDYGNLGYNVASLAMDAATGESWKDVLDRLIFTPLGMRSTTGYVSRVPQDRLAMPYGAEPTGFRRLPYAKVDGNMHAAGGLVSSAEDLARWLEVQITGGTLDGRRVFPAEVMAEVHREQAHHDDRFRNYQRFAYGLGWQHAVYDGDTLVHHFGGFPGFGAHVSFMPRHRLGVAVLMNESSLGGVLSDVAAKYVYDKLRGRPDVDAVLADTLRSFRTQAAAQRQRIADDRARRAARPQALPLPLAAYAGTYENDLLGTLTWRVVDGRLEASIGALRSVAEVYDGTKHALRVELVPNSGDVVQFVAQDGRVTGLQFSGREFRRIEP